MGGNALAAMEDLDRARRDARPNLLAQQLRAAPSSSASSISTW